MYHILAEIDDLIDRLHRAKDRMIYNGDSVAKIEREIRDLAYIRNEVENILRSR